MSDETATVVVPPTSRVSLAIGDPINTMIEEFKKVGWDERALVTEALARGLEDPSVGPERGLLPGAPAYPHPYCIDVYVSAATLAGVKRVAEVRDVETASVLRGDAHSRSGELAEGQGVSSLNDSRRDFVVSFDEFCLTDSFPGVRVRHVRAIWPCPPPRISSIAQGWSVGYGLVFSVGLRGGPVFGASCPGLIEASGRWGGRRGIAVVRTPPASARAARLGRRTSPPGAS